MADVDYNQVQSLLESVGIEHSMTILKELEDNRRSVLDPTAFVKDAIFSSRKRSAVRTPGQTSARAAGSSGQGARRAGSGGSGGGGDIAALSNVIGMLNKNSKVAKPIKFSDVAGALDTLGPARALRVLQEMQEKGLGLADPVQYIRSKAAMVRPVKDEDEEEEELDDVQKITRRLGWLNQFGGLAKKIRSDEVMGALYCLGVPQSMAILKGLQEKGKSVPDPTSYIKTAVQRANGVRVSSNTKKETIERELEGEESAEVDAYGVGEEAFYAAALAEAAEVDDIAAAAFAEVGADYDAPAPATPPGAAELAAQRRVPGAVKGLKKLTSAPTKSRPAVVPKIEFRTDDAGTVTEAADTRGILALGVTPHEKMVQCRNYAVKSGLNLDEAALRALAKLPFYKAKDLIEETLLGGKRRQGVSNASRYIITNCEKLSHGLGVEQGIAMELAVSLGVVLNNEALDELASVPRKEAHSIIREVSKNEEARQEPIEFIRAEVRKCRAQLDARPFPFKR